jgi:hypothetical protein
VQALCLTDSVTDRWSPLKDDPERGLELGFDWAMFTPRQEDSVYKVYYTHKDADASKTMWKDNLSEEEGIRRGLLVEDEMVKKAWEDGFVYTPPPVLQAPLCLGQAMTQIPYHRLNSLGGTVCAALMRIQPICNSGPADKYSGIKVQLVQLIYGRGRPNKQEIARRKAANVLDVPAKVPPLPFAQSAMGLLLENDNSHFGDEHEQSLLEAARQVDEAEFKAKQLAAAQSKSPLSLSNRASHSSFG